MFVLDRGRTRYAAQYGPALADHLPMTLVALASMGASKRRLSEYARKYIEHRGLRVLDCDDREWTARAALRERIDMLGRASVLTAELSVLGAGIGAGAFHALIRVAYGISEGDDDEIAAGLTYWRDASLDLGAPTIARETKLLDVGSALERIRTMLAIVADRISDRGHIAAQMELVAGDASFDVACGHPLFGESPLVGIAAAAVRAFAATQNFRLLHAMTATHAMRIVLPMTRESDDLMQYFWRALVAAYVSAGAPPIASEEAWRHEIDRTADWPTLHARACASDDEHVIKSTYTAWAEDNVYHDPLYRIAAQRYLDRTP